MARCELSIQLDDPNRVYKGGDLVSGTVHVQADRGVRCKQLEISSLWRTHGSGNVAQEKSDSTVVFQGDWLEDQSYSYRFELTLGEWPPSYHGHHLNVDHYVHARAYVPWSIDPKVDEPVIMRPESIDQSLVEEVIQKGQAVPGCVKAFGAMFGVTFIGVLAVFLIVAPFLAIFVLPIALIGGGIWFAKSVLPKRALGQVELQVPEAEVVPGSTITGQLRIHPTKPVRINAITTTLTGSESCVGGSGSNRRTHRHEFLKRQDVLATEITLKPNQDNVYDVAIKVPADAPYSIKLSDNELIWGIEFRVDIPRWPDWVERRTLQVLPPIKSEGQVAASPSLDEAEQTIAANDGAVSATKIADQSGPVAAVVSSANDATDHASTGVSFDETIRLIASYADNQENIEMVTEAVIGMQMEATFTVDRRLLYAGDEQQHMERGEKAWWAIARPHGQSDSPVRLVVYVKDNECADWQAGQVEDRTGRVEVLGYDSAHDRLRIRWLAT